MGANIAGIYGAQIFRQDDRPRYRRAFSVACAVLAFGLVLAIVRYLDDVVRRRRKARQPSAIASDSDNTSQDDKEAIAPPSKDQPGPILLDQKGAPIVSAGLRGTT